MPVVAVIEPGPEAFHPIHPIITFLAKISPKPSITPLTNGSSILIATEEKRALTRVRVDKVESKIASVAVGGSAS